MTTLQYMPSSSNDEKEFNERDISKLERNRPSVSQDLLQPRQNKAYSQEQPIRSPDNTKHSIEKMRTNQKQKLYQIQTLFLILMDKYLNQ